MYEIRHIGIVTSDDKIEKMLKFYDSLGLKLHKQGFESKETMETYTCLKLCVKTYKLLSEGGSMVELLVFPKSTLTSKEVNSRSITHIAFTVDDLSNIKNKIKENGGIILSKKNYRRDKISPWVVFCKDPDGNILEIVEEKG